MQKKMPFFLSKNLVIFPARNDEKINLSTLIKSFFDRRVEKRRLSGELRRGFSRKYIGKWQKSDGQFIFYRSQYNI